MVFSTSQIIDWDLGAELVGGSREDSEEMLAQLLVELPLCHQQINKLWKEKNLTALKDVVHKLFGGTCYCPTPRLKEAAKQLDIHLLKSNTAADLSALYDCLNNEIQAVLNFNTTGIAS